MPSKMRVRCQNGARADVALCPIENIQYKQVKLNDINATYFECDLCSKIYKMRSRLKNHLKVHISVTNGFSENGLYEIGQNENVSPPLDEVSSKIKMNGTNGLKMCQNVNRRTSIAIQINTIEEDSAYNIHLEMETSESVVVLPEEAKEFPIKPSVVVIEYLDVDKLRDLPVGISKPKDKENEVLSIFNSEIPQKEQLILHCNGVDVPNGNQDVSEKLTNQNDVPNGSEDVFQKLTNQNYVPCDDLMGLKNPTILLKKVNVSPKSPCLGNVFDTKKEMNGHQRERMKKMPCQFSCCSNLKSPTIKFKSLQQECEIFATKHLNKGSVRSIESFITYPEPTLPDIGSTLPSEESYFPLIAPFSPISERAPSISEFIDNKDDKDTLEELLECKVLLHRLTKESLEICKERVRASCRERKLNARYHNDDFMIDLKVSKEELKSIDDSKDFEIPFYKPKNSRNSTFYKMNSRKKSSMQLSPSMLQSIERRKAPKPLRRVTIVRRPRIREKSTSCSRCNKSFLTKWYLPLHVKHVHKNIRDFHCEICVSSFKTNAGLSSHTEALHSFLRIYQCDVCLKLFKLKKQVVEHKKGTHATEKKFKCDVCCRMFATKDRVRNHMAQSHYAVRKFWCNECDGKFKVKSHLVMHMKGTHLKIRSVCRLCGKEFYSISNLYTHVNSVHHNIRRFKCPICNSRFAARTTMKLHYRSVHQGLRPYQCDLCKQTFKFTGHLTKHHQVRHLGLRPFKCPKCGKNFDAKSSLNIHVKCVHNKIKDLQCNLCGKRFAIKHQLATHKMAHDKKFFCALCYRTLSGPVCLRNHIKKVHTFFS